MHRNGAGRKSVVIAIVVIGALAAAFVSRRAIAHCQVPCGIYDDKARVAQLREDTATIEKAIKSMNELVGETGSQAFNQATRWVMTKEQHASHIITVVAEYFLTQKVKPVARGEDGYMAYLKKLADHHAVMTAAMKTKQHSDAKYVVALRAAIDGLAKHYK